MIWLKKVTAIIGSPRKGQTFEVVKQFEQELRKYGEIDIEYVLLRDKNIQPCRGCGICLELGEELCPLKDDLSEVVELMLDSDGMIFAAPVYSLQVPALMKNLLDRMAYVFHRPQFFHKVFMPIVTQGVYGDKEVLKYLESVSRFWGFKFCHGTGLTTPLNGALSASQQKQLDRELPKAAKRFYNNLLDRTPTSPRIMDILLFRMMRTIHKYGAGLQRDSRYFLEQGWFEADYFYDVKLGPIKRIVGWWADKIGEKQAEKVKKEQVGLV